MNASPRIDETTLAVLDKACAECQHALETQNDETLREAMQKVCDACRPIRALLPDLLELQQAHAVA